MTEDSMADSGYFETLRANENQALIDKASRNDPRRIKRQESAKNTIAPKLGNPRIGVVMRTKERAVLLRRALESVRDQTYPDWHLIVVNDGGDPGMVDWLVAHIMKGDPRVSVLHHLKSKGMEAACNAALSMLETDYALVHDDDDSLAPEFMAVMISTLRRQSQNFPSLKGIVCRTNIVSETVLGNEITVEKVEPFTPLIRAERLDEGFLSVQRMLVRNQFPPIAFLFELEAARDLGFLNEALPSLSDWDFNIRFVLRHDIWIQPEFLSFHHQRAATLGAFANAANIDAANHRIYQQKARNDSMRAFAGINRQGSMTLALQTEISDSFEYELKELRKAISKIDLKLTPKAYPKPLWKRLLSRLKRDTLRARGRLLRRVNQIKKSTFVRNKKG